jgi:hypothetical protein
VQLPRTLFQTIPLLCLLLTGCASISEVKKEDRDLSYSYDGVWVAKHQTTKSWQTYGSWEFTCPQATSPVKLMITGSHIRTLVDNKYLTPLNEAYVSSTGSFKTSLPTDFKGKTSVFSDIDHSDIEIRVIIEGILTPEGDGTGSFTVGWATAKYKGCKTKLIFTKWYITSQVSRSYSR